MKKTRDSTSDIISDLPGAILENILVCLPIQDAVRTSVLSKKWRYKWALIPELVFDDSLISIEPATSHSQPLPFGQENMIMRKILLLVISQVLMLHRAPVLKFTLSVPGLQGGPEIDNMITFLMTNKGVEELTLEFGEGEYYKLPSSLFTGQKLTCLSLRHCNFRPPSKFEGFSRLVCLELIDVWISRESFARMISSCSLLEELIVETFHTYYDPLEIDSHSLKISKFYGNFKSIRFKNAPRLAIVALLSKAPGMYGALWEPNKGDPFGWFDFFTNLPVLENLEMDEYYVKSLDYSTAAPKLPIENTLGRLKILKLHGLEFNIPGVIRIALCLMVPPKLQKLKIKMKSSGKYDQGLEYLQRCGTFVFDQLREVELGITSGTPVELHFIKILLARSRVLEKLILKPEPGWVCDGGLKILRELAEFQRLSPNAKVTYKDPDSVDSTNFWWKNAFPQPS